MNNTNSSDKDVLIHEIEKNLWETWANFGRGPGCTLHEREDMLWFETPLPFPPYNGMLRFQVRDNVDQAIDQVIEHFARKQVQLVWVLHPSSHPSDLHQRLLDRGLMDVEPIIGMARTLDDLPEPPPLPDDITIREVVDSRDVTALTQFASWRWNVPEEYSQHYMKIIESFRFGQSGSRAHMWQAWRDGQPVAKAGMNLGSSAAGIYAVATKPEARKLGLARALTLAALRHAREQGYNLAVLHSSPMAVNLYSGMGFDTLAEFRLFASGEFHV